MNCFNHQQVSAIGICKFCQKGLCSECAVDLEHGIACKHHQEEVVTLNDIQSYSKRAVQNTGKMYKQISMIFAFLGIVMILGGLILGKYVPIIIFLGIGTLLFAVFYSVFGSRLGKSKSN
jgi:hypothetical protein